MPDWETIVRLHAPMAYEAAYRVVGDRTLAEDVLQEVFLEACQLPGREAVTNWGGMLRQMAVRRAIDQLRRRRTLVPLNDSAAKVMHGPEGEAMARELAMRLRGGIALLPEQEAIVFSLHYFGGTDHEEIARILGITSHGVGVALHKARARLKAILTAGPALKGVSRE